MPVDAATPLRSTVTEGSATSSVAIVSRSVMSPANAGTKAIRMGRCRDGMSVTGHCSIPSMRNDRPSLKRNERSLTGWLPLLVSETVVHPNCAPAGVVANWIARAADK